MIEFKNKAIDSEYYRLDEEALELEARLREINDRQKYMRENYEQE